MGTHPAGEGDTVTFRFSIILEDGSRVDSRAASPLTFTIGEKKVFQALEQGVVGMEVHEVRDILVKAGQGYGDYKEDLVLRVDREVFPADLQLVVGRTIQYQNRDGQRANFIVREVSGERVTLDGNHPLAGQNLTYRLELLEIG